MTSAQSLWLPTSEASVVDRFITSATLQAGDSSDAIELYVRGEHVASFSVAAGDGEGVLREMGLQPTATQP